MERKEKQLVRSTLTALLAIGAICAGWFSFGPNGILKSKDRPRTSVPAEVARGTQQVSKTSRHIRELMRRANPFVQYSETDSSSDDENIPETLPEIADEINRILDSLNNPTGDLTPEDFDKAQARLNRLLILAVDLIESVDDPALDDFCEDLGVTRHEMGNILMTQYEVLDQYYKNNMDSMSTADRAQVEEDLRKLNFSAYMFFIVGPLPRNE